MQFFDQRRHIKKISFALLSVLILFSIACSRFESPLDQNTLNIEAPFGFSWEEFDRVGTTYGDHPEEGCREQVRYMEALTPPDKSESLLENCVVQKVRITFLDSDQVPNFFRHGEVSVAVRGWSEPVEYSYSFLHRILMELDHDLNVNKRKKHAKKIKDQLIGLYGPPDASGYFDQSFPQGFMSSAEENQPCDLWIKGDVAILLCAERVALLDGIEMSLSFTRLDRVPYDEVFRCMVTSAADDCLEQANLIPSMYPRRSTFFLDHLAEWLGPSTLQSCQSEHLEPLEDQLMLSPELEAKAVEVLQIYNGELLAEYVYENASDIISLGDKGDGEKMILFYLMTAANQGSFSAMNEIGNSLLYCSQNVQQNIPEALTWLQKAESGGDFHAQYNLAFMHLSGMIDSTPDLIEAERLLESCSTEIPASCAQKWQALREFKDFIEG